MSPTSPSRLRLAVLALVLGAVALLAGACSSPSSDAGAGFRLAGSQLRSAAPATTPTSSGPSGPDTGFPTVVATAAVPELEVLAQRPGGPAPAPVADGGRVAPIPRPDLNSAGARKTGDGWAFTNPTYFGSPLNLVVVHQEGEWLEVMVPARPNGQHGWVRAADVTLSQHDFHGQLTLSDTTLRVWQGSELVAETPVVIGTDRTPTPEGRLYISEILTAAQAGVSAGGAYGPYVLPTNAYSPALELFDEGLPVIAFHGTNAPGLLGSQASNGCIRLPNDVITQLAGTIPAGTPIDVTA